MKKKMKKLMVDHYEVLGLPTGEQGAKLTEKQITKAYKAKALQLHPDKRPNDPNANAEFQKLKSSYEILINPEARKRFDASLVSRITNKPHDIDPYHIFRELYKAQREGNYRKTSTHEAPKPKGQSNMPRPHDMHYRKSETPKPKGGESPSEPNSDIDDYKKLQMYVIGFVVCAFAPLLFPATRSQAGIMSTLCAYMGAFEMVSEGQNSQFWPLYGWIFHLGSYFASQYHKLKPPQQAADNQQSQDREDIEDWVMV